MEYLRDREPHPEDLSPRTEDEMSDKMRTWVSTNQQDWHFEDQQGGQVSKTCFWKVWKGAEGSVCDIVFEQAEPSDPDVIERHVKKKKHWESAIVVPPKHEGSWSPEQLDNWCIRVILMLKRFTKGSTHIVCENTQDATATLVAVPSGRA